MTSTYRKQLETWLKELDVDADVVLDVGGSQLPVRDRVKSFNVKYYGIVDLQKPHEGEKPDYIVDLNDVTNSPTPQADIVFCLEVMEYVWDPQTALMNLKSMTKPGGILHITFPYFYPPHEPYQNDYLRYTFNGAKKLLESSGFRMEIWKSREATGDGLLTAIKDNALRPSKSGTPAELWQTLGFIITAKRI